VIRPLLLLCAALSCGCDTTTVNFITEVMPGRTANLDVENRELTLSRGAAIAFECTEYAEAWSGPCRAFALTVDDEDIVDARPAFLAQPAGTTAQPIASDGADGQQVQGTQPRTGGVLAAKRAGDTAVTIESQTGRVDLTVRVVE
jgi:hypothetical protein